MNLPAILPTVPESRFINRELSWLEFNARVLALAEDPKLPLLERVKFLAISRATSTSSSRSGSRASGEQVAAGVVTSRTPDGLSPAEQLGEIRERCLELLGRADEALLALFPLLEAAGVRIVGSTTWARTTAPRCARHSTSASSRSSRRSPWTPPTLPVHLEPVAEPGSDRPRPRHRREPVRPREGPAAPAALLELPDGERLVPIEEVIADTSTPCSRGWRSCPATRSGSPATPTSRSRGRGGGPALRRSRACSGAAAGPRAPSGSRSTAR